MNESLKTLIIDFLEYCEIGKNQSEKTLINYDHYLFRFANFVGDMPLKKIDMKTIQKYRLYLNRFTDKNGRTLSIKTQGFHLIALRAFFKYLVKNDIACLAPEKIELPKIEERQVEFLTREEIQRLFDSIDISKKTGARDIAIIETLYSTGLRVSELCALNKDQVDLQKREFMVRGKGKKLRIVFISEKASERISQYLQKRNDHFIPLFISLSNRTKAKSDFGDGEDRRMKSQDIERVVREQSKKAGIIKKVTPHTIRHSFATEMLFNGADIRTVQELLGHASITTTQIYTHVTNQRLRESYEKYHR